MIKPDKKFMHEAIRHAKLAKKNGDYAIGAVVARGNKIIFGTGTRSKRDDLPVSHAEVLAIIGASKILKTRHISDCILYTTHESCPMCTATAIWAKLKGIVYGARIEDMARYSKKSGNHHFEWRTIRIPCREVIKRSSEKIYVVEDFMRDECNLLFHT